MRYAWLREQSPSPDGAKQAFIHPFALLRFAYNAVFWVFLVPFFTTLPYQVGFIAFSVVILFRFAANLFTNNVLDLSPAQYERYPLRIP